MATSRFRSVALLAAASLSLAACGGGGGGSTSTTPTPPADTTALDARETALDARETALDARKKKLDATAQQQTQKDKEQAAKERELNNRPPGVVTRTVGGPTRTVTVQAPPTHVGFSGSGLSSDEVNVLAHKVIDIQIVPNLILGAPEDRLQHVHTKVFGKNSYVMPKLISSTSEQNVVSHKLKIYHKDPGSDYEGILYWEDFRPTTADDGYKIFELSSPTDITGLGLGDAFSFKLFKETVNNNKLHVEVATDYASDNKIDYLSFGWWVQVPTTTTNISNYNLGVFAHSPYLHANSQFNALTGVATYTGSMMGLHTEIESSGRAKLSRLTGKAVLTADFGDESSPGSLVAVFDELKLNGTAATGSITFTETMQGGSVNGYLEDAPNLATINGSNYKGIFIQDWLGSAGSSSSNIPTGMVGTLKGTTDDRSKAFTASFGVKKTE